jgi:hypothetical protein
MRQVRSALRRVAARLGAAVVIAAGGASAEARAADYEFRAEYRITLNGLPIGRAMLQGSFESADYRLDGSAKLTGIAGLLFDYSSTAASAGRIRAGRLHPSAFSADSSDGHRSMSVRMTLANDAVRRLDLDPPITRQQERNPRHVPITAAHRRGIVDPMTAMVGFGGFDGASFGSGICDRAIPVFNGRERFDIELEYDGMRDVNGARGGYEGPALVCTARYRAVAGHRDDKDEIRYLEERMVFEVVLVPVEGSDLLVPYRVVVPTPLGSAALQITDVTSSGAMASRSAALSD